MRNGNRCAVLPQGRLLGHRSRPRRALAAQREDYLLKALRDFKGGARTGGGVAAMADVVHPLGDEQLRALAHFMAHLP